MSKNENRQIQLKEVGELAAQTARSRLLAALEDQGVDHTILAMAANDLLFATKQKAQWDAKAGKFQYSDYMTDNTTRLGALKTMLDLYDVMPSKKLDINDKRQTKELADRLLDRMEEMQQLGVEDRGVPQMCDAEEQLMGDMVEMQRDGSGFIPTQDEEGEDGADD